MEELTIVNARLRRQALILSLLPDLVIVVDEKGQIVFCSAQVERALQYQVDHLVTANFYDLLIPKSRTKLKKLISNILSPDAKNDNDVNKSAASKRRKQPEPLMVSSGPSSGSDAAIKKSSKKKAGDGSGSDKVFPLSVVKVAARMGNGSDTSDSNKQEVGSKQPSSLTNSGGSSDDNSGNKKKSESMDAETSSDDNNNSNKTASKNKRKSPNNSSDGSNSSSLSTDAKKLQKANENLERNVRQHNNQMNLCDGGFNYKDDVTGAMVTANNASARLSSLLTKAESSSEESDSGYRESNESREESSTTASDLSSSKDRLKPLAPTCNVCLVRSDLSTLWCEVTSSVRTRDPNETMSQLSDSAWEDSKPFSKNTKRTDDTKSSSMETMESSEDLPVLPLVREVLLCLRPIRDGEKADESLRFSPKLISEAAFSSSGGDFSDPQEACELARASGRPLKKRRAMEDDMTM